MLVTGEGETGWTNSLKQVRKAHVDESFRVGDNGLFMFHQQNHGLWCLDGPRSKGIRSYGIDLVIPDYAWFQQHKCWKYTHISISTNAKTGGIYHYKHMVIQYRNIIDSRAASNL